MAIEITRYRRAPNFRNCDCPANPWAGSTRAVTISPDNSAVWRTPVIKSCSGIFRTPAVLAISTSASKAIRHGTPSAAGDALQILPTTVAAFWIWAEPTSHAACFSISHAGGKSARMTSLQLAAAPMRIPDEFQWSGDARPTAPAPHPMSMAADRGPNRPLPSLPTAIVRGQTAPCQPGRIKPSFICAKILEPECGPRPRSYSTLHAAKAAMFTMSFAVDVVEQI